MKKNLKDEYDAKYSSNNLKISPYFKKQFNYLLKFSKKKIKGAILDLGCGTGEYSIEFQKMGFEVIGADISQVAIDNAKKIGVKKTLVFDFNKSEIDQKFDCIFVKGFSPLNISDLDQFKKIILKLKELVTQDGVIFYWGITDFSKSFSNSGWFNWDPDNLKELLNLQVLLVFRWQVFLPVKINNMISFLLI